jgi:hypothetical protein
LGNGDPVGPQQCGPTEYTSNCGASPVQVALDETVISLGCGCAVTDAGSLWCWGENQSGRLGEGAEEGPEKCQVTHSCAPTPWQVAGLDGTDMVEVGGSTGHTCAVDASGMVQCWGSNTYGQLGVGDDEGRLKPTPVTGDHQFVALSVSGVASCAIDDTGALWCWGDNRGGQLALGTLAGPQACDGALGSPGTACALSPQASLEFGVLVEVKLGPWASGGCALTDANHLYCWDGGAPVPTRVL